jgi:hypothetical protein
MQDFIVENDIDYLVIAHGSGATRSTMVSKNLAELTGNPQYENVWFYVKNNYPEGANVACITCSTYQKARVNNPNTWKIFKGGNPEMGVKQSRDVIQEMAKKAKRDGVNNYPLNKFVLPKGKTIDDIDPSDIGKLKVKVRKWNSTQSMHIEQDWLHGTALVATPDQFRAIDPLEGGTASELGLGVYLTRDLDVAEAAGMKGNLKGKPPTPMQFDHAKPKVFTVNVRHLDGVLNGNDAMGSDLRRMWDVTVKETLEVNGIDARGIELPSTLKIRDMFNYLDQAYYELYGDILPATVVREFQYNLTELMRDNGIKGMHVNRNNIKTMVIYDPSILEVTSTLPIARTNDYGETLEAGRYLARQTMEQMDDEVSKANFYEAEQAWLDWQLQQNVENRIRKENRLIGLSDEIVDAEDEFWADFAKEREALIDGIDGYQPDEYVNDIIRDADNNIGGIC